MGLTPLAELRNDLEDTPILPDSPAMVFRALDREPLNSRHRHELKDSGISDELITQSGIRTVSGEEICKMLNWEQEAQEVGSGWAIPFDDPNSCDCYWRVKLDQPRKRGNDPIKYESPIGSTNRAYKPPGFDDSRGKLIVITEGEKKSLSAMSHGVNCLGLTGVWNWQQRRKRDDSGRSYGSRILIDDLSAINWAKREVIVAFDSDAIEKHSVELAQQKLAEALAKLGANVKVARLPQGDDSRKSGLDDAIVNLGIDNVRDILCSAQKPELPQLSWPDLARIFVDLWFSQFGEPTIRYWRNEFWRWNGFSHEVVMVEEIKTAVYQFLEEIAQKPNRNAVAEVVTALKAEVVIDSKVEPPIYLDTRAGEFPGTPLIFSNCVAFLDFDYDLLEEPLPTTTSNPRWFITGARDFPYTAHGACPTWDGFLERSLPDPVGRRLLQQWFGYVLSGRSDRQKILVLHGSRRGGKSIIADTMGQLIGESAVATSSLSGLNGEFGLEPLIGKQLLLVPEAQDRGMCLAAVERLKAISGCDRLDVNKKNKPILTGIRLQTRVVITCNQLPRFLDPSGALHSRLLVVHFPISFVGREDWTLQDKIRTELPGIFNWAYRGWLDLKTSGFVIPPSSTDVLDRAEHTLSPVKAFLDECCIIDSKQRIPVDELWAAWQQWCCDSRHQSGNKQKLGSDLSGALPTVERCQVRVNGMRRYFYAGVALNMDGSALLQKWQRAAYRRA